MRILMTDDTTNTNAKSNAERRASKPRAVDVYAATIKATMETSGIVCPKCGCCDTRVLHTYPGDNEKGRRRVCRHCGTRITTLEIPVS